MNNFFKIRAKKGSGRKKSSDLFSDTPIDEPPVGVYFWKQDLDNGDYGWDYKKGDGVTTVDTYYSGVIKINIYLEK